MNERDFLNLKRKAEEAAAAKNKATGQLDMLMKQLTDKYGCKTLDEAEKMLAKMQRETEKAEAEYNKAAKVFEEKWNEHLDQ
jgi:hypothetical protein